MWESLACSKQKERSTTIESTKFARFEGLEWRKGASFKLSLPCEADLACIVHIAIAS
jgi:hypothetical protein